MIFVVNVFKGSFFMCTCVWAGGKYFGRNLDVENSYGETVTIMPRNYNISFSNGEKIKTKYALIGMAYVSEDYPLFFDCGNEKGLCVAALNFPDFAVYNKPKENYINIASYEFITYITSNFASIDELMPYLKKVNITDNSFSKELPAKPLHFMISDRYRTIVAEPTEGGLKIYDNPTGVMTNAPSFDFHLMSLNNYMSLSNGDAKNTFSKNLNLNCYSKGMGAIGLPGDYSSVSRFVKATFVKDNTIFGKDEKNNINRFFDILYSVKMPYGCINSPLGYEFTSYSCCIDTLNMIYYYTTIDNSTITSVDIKKEDLESKKLIKYQLIQNQNIFMQNG